MGRCPLRRYLAGLTLLIAATAFSGASHAGQTVKVGAYYFPPFVQQTATGIGGMVVDLVALMNAAQSTYTFELVDTSATGRYDDMASGRIDMIAFEDADWGWRDMNVVASDVFMTGAEVYVALAEPGRDQSYFDDVADLKIAAVYGFHYGFADFNADPGFLQTNFMVELPLDPYTALFHVIDRHTNVAVVSRAYLETFLKRHPEYAETFLISDKVDQEYRHAIVMRADAGPSVGEIDALLAEIKSSGAFDEMLASYGLQGWAEE